MYVWVNPLNMSGKIHKIVRPKKIKQKSKPPHSKGIKEKMMFLLDVELTHLSNELENGGYLECVPDFPRQLLPK